MQVKMEGHLHEVKCEWKWKGIGMKWNASENGRALAWNEMRVVDSFSYVVKGASVSAWKNKMN